MKTLFLNPLLLIAWMSLTLHAYDEGMLIAVLRSNTGPVEKCYACQQLRIHGTERSVASLAALLTEERVGLAARYALEGMPYPSAGDALREALAKTSGLMKVGVVDSLGWRRDTAAVSLLVPLLGAGDPTLVAATARALGRIGGAEATGALVAVLGKQDGEAGAAISGSVLDLADRRQSSGDAAEAEKLYRRFFDLPEVTPAVYAAAWRGLVQSNQDRRAALMLEALSGNDPFLRPAALSLLRELNDLAVIRACLAAWDTLPAVSQMAVLNAHLELGAEVLPTVRRASESADVAVRTAAWQALANLSDPSLIPALAAAATSGEVGERDTARQTLSLVRGPSVRKALLNHLNQAAPKQQAEILRALGERQDTEAMATLLEHARSPQAPVRLAALQALVKLALPDSLMPLLDLAANAESGPERVTAMNALSSVCRASSDKEQTTRSIITAMGAWPASRRESVLPLLAELATEEALVALADAATDGNTELALASIRVLTQWPTAAPNAALISIARSDAEPVVRLLALRGVIAVAGQEGNLDRRLAWLKEVRPLVKRVEENRLFLGQLGQIPSAEALGMALEYLEEPALVEEAGQAAVSIAGALAPADPNLGDETAAVVLTQCRNPDVIKKALALRLNSAVNGPFIRNWKVCGPFSKPGVAGATALFDIPFGPEQGNKVDWTAVPAGDSVNLSGLFPGQDNCVAYLQAKIIAPASGPALLLSGSDDGLKAWLNGEVVHSNNVDRGMVTDQDMAPITLQEGANELLLKVTQGGGGWSACARIVGMDGRPIERLRAE